MPIEAPGYPIIYVRGFAATMNEIEDTVATPYMGFNLGATKIRQNYEGEIRRFIFESPLIRLLKDEGYVDTYRDGDLIPRGERVPAKSVWIFRYYESVSEDLGEGERRSIVRFAADLRELILRVRDQVCGDDADERARFKVHLVAHSMGGLVCRCYLQNICRHGVADAYPGDPERVEAENERLELAAPPADPLVDKVFTYATPHNGIDLGGLNAPDLGRLDPVHIRNFNRGHMREYLRLSGNGDRVDSLDGHFPAERFFCFVGTNHRDYVSALARKVTGPMSDGLVMMRNATVDGAPRAFGHRCHSGPYGIVNSEEGYQNLRRFLFGDVRVDATLLIDEITLPKAVEDVVGNERDRVRAAYNIEAAATIRGLNVYLNERRVDQQSAIRRTYEELVHDNKAIYLFSGYLLKRAKTPDSRDTALAFAVDLSIQVPLYEIDRKLWLDQHFEGSHLYRGTVTFFVREGPDGTRVRHSVTATSGASVQNRALEALGLDAASSDSDAAPRHFEIPIGFDAETSRKPRPGVRGRLRLTTSLWQ